MKDDIIIHDTETGRFPDPLPATKAQWKDLSIRELIELTQDAWKEMPKGIFVKTPKLVKRVEVAMKKYPKMEKEETQDALRVIMRRYAFEYARRRKSGEL